MPPKMTICGRWLPIPSTFGLLGLSHDAETSCEPANLRCVPEDAVLISIDVENCDAFIPTSTDGAACAQMGIAVLDSRLLRGGHDDNFTVQTSSHATTPIHTNIIATGTPRYLHHAARKYLFGELMIRKPSDFLAALYDLLPPDRPYIFIGHNFATERRVLRNLGFKPSPRLLGFSDNERPGDDGPDKPASLKKTLTRLECPYRNLHCAGNDAHFTLRAFLLLTEHFFLKRHPEFLLQGGMNYQILSAIIDIALAPLPEPEPVKQPPPDTGRAAYRAAREAVLQTRVAWRADQAKIEDDLFQQGGFGDATRRLFQ